MVENKTVLTIVGGIGFLILLVIITLFIVSIFTDVYEDFTDTTLSSSGIVLADNGTATTLTESATGITSATAHNDSWLEFDGINDWVSLTNSEDRPTTNATITGWMKPNNIFNSGKLLRIGVSQGTKQGIHISFASGPEIQCYIGNGSVGAEADMNIDDSYLNVWKFYSCTFNGTTGSLYENGVLNTSASFSSQTSIDYTDEVWRVGAFNSGSGLFSGGIDEVRVYNSTLSGSQILEIYNSGRIANSSLPSDGLVLWYSFNSGVGTTIYDKSGNGNHGS